MPNVKISDLPNYAGTLNTLPDDRIAYYGGTALYDPVYMPAVSGHTSVKITVEDIARQVKRALGYLEKPLVKCGHCGQWGVAYCACRHCGAPIDPVV